MTELGRLKRGDDKTFRTIVVSVDGAPQDLTAEGWGVAGQLRTSEDSPTYMTLTIASAPLENSEIVASLTAAQTRQMAAATWLGDIQVTSPAGVTKSATFTVVVKPDVTRVALEESP